MRVIKRYITTFKQERGSHNPQFEERLWKTSVWWAHEGSVNKNQDELQLGVNMHNRGVGLSGMGNWVYWLGPKVNTDFLSLVSKFTYICGCSSGVEPVSCYWKVAGSVPLAEMSLGKKMNSKLLPDMLVSILHGSHHHSCMNYCKSLWTKVSAIYPKMYANETFVSLNQTKLLHYLKCHLLNYLMWHWVEYWTALSIYPCNVNQTIQKVTINLPKNVCSFKASWPPLHHTVFDLIKRRLF